LVCAKAFGSGACNNSFNYFLTEEKMKKVNYKKGLWTNLDTSVRPQYYGTKENVSHYHEVKDSSVGRFMHDNGMAQTRAYCFAKAIEEIYSALCHCDKANQKMILKDYPELLTIAQFYADLNGSPNRNFRAEEWAFHFFNETEEV
jgi:hypothetical protein